MTPVNKRVKIAPMIVDVPSPEEFSEAGLNQLHLAWEIGVQLVRELQDGVVETWDASGEVSDEYWRLSEPALGNAFALVQQAQEFALKGRIAAVSPFLLLTRDSREWPKRCDKKDVPFSAFRTADAGELIKIHDTVCHHRLSAEFAHFYEEIRRQRNTIIHHGPKGQRIEASSLLVNVLRTYDYLWGDTPWPSRRKEYLSSDRLAVVYSNDFAGDALLFEFDLVVSTLKPAQVKRFFEFDKKARRYICPHCMGDAEDQRIALAQLRPNTPTATEVYCFVCGRATKVRREACPETGCSSNVICAEPDDDGSCLICW